MLAVKLEFEQLVRATPTQAYNAFTNATALRQWLCDIATVKPTPSGRFYIAWNSGYYASGEFTDLKENEYIRLTWVGRNEPGATSVQVMFDKLEGGTFVKLIHTGIGNDEDWRKIKSEYEKGWKESLENLASLLETGVDLRIIRRPMLGIIIGDFSPEHAKKLGVPVTAGVRLDDVVDGMGAQSVGLQSNDVIVEMAGVKMDGYNDISNPISGKRAGDSINVIFYRGREKKEVEMELSKRTIPEIPPSPKELAEAVKRIYSEVEVKMEKIFKNVTEAQVTFKLTSSEWSAKEVLAHLIHSERFQQAFTAELVTGYTRWADDFGGNLYPWIRATVDAYPTLTDLLDQFKRCMSETISLYSNLPGDFPKLNKGSYWQLAAFAIDGSYHFDSHLEQIENAIAASKE